MAELKKSLEERRKDVGPYGEEEEEEDDDDVEIDTGEVEEEPEWE